MTWVFGECELDVATRRLLRGGDLVHVQPKVFDFLVYLLRHRDRVVAKDELLSKLWPDVVVTASVIPKVLKNARKAVGDDGEKQVVLQTIHGRGYRFIAEVLRSGHLPSTHDGEDRSQEGALETLMAEAEELRRGEEPHKARRVYLDVVAGARDSGDPRLFARAVRGYVGQYIRPRAPDRGFIELLEEALGSVDENECNPRGPLLARLAAEYSYDEAHKLRNSLRAEALEDALRCQDLQAMLDTLTCPFAHIWELVPTTDRRSLALRSIERARVDGRIELEIAARIMLLKELYSVGELAVVGEELERLDRLAQKAGDSVARYIVTLNRATLATLFGDFARASDLVEEAYALGRIYKGMEVYDLYVAQRIVVGIAEGNAAECAALYERILAESEIPSGTCLRIWVLAEAGERREAEEQLHLFMRHYGAVLSALSTWEGNAAALATASALIRCDRYAGRLYEVLAPLSGRNIMRGHYGCLGPADRFLGQLAALQKRFDVARRHFERAQIHCEHMGALPLLARTYAEHMKLCAPR